MKKLFCAMLAFALLLSAAAAGAEDAGILGRPFPDFTAADTEGNVFTLSEALKDHEAVLINIWASWCPPCEAEFPYLNEAYERYGDRVAFIALSCEETDTMETVEAYRRSHGLTLPMGRDENGALFGRLNVQGIPDTVIVDRFGNAAFLHVGSFISAGEVSRTLDFFLGDGYRETVVLDEPPRESATGAFPVSRTRSLRVENENARMLHYRIAGFPEPLTAYVIPDETARLTLCIAAGDNPSDIVYYDQGTGVIWELPSLLDAESGVYAYSQPMPDPAGGGYATYGCMVNISLDEDPDGLEVYLLAGEEYIEEYADTIRMYGYEVSWEWAEPVPAEDAPPETYVLYVKDQYGEPVPGVYVNFCTDEACTMLRADEAGVIAFDGEPQNYHVQLLAVPGGYSFDPAFEFYTGSGYGEWSLRIRKD